METVTTLSIVWTAVLLVCLALLINSARVSIDPEPHAA